VKGSAVKVEVPGRGALDAIELQFNPQQEGWSEYRVSDGGLIRMRATALHVYRVVDRQGRPAFLPDGQPDYIVTTQTQMTSTGGQIP
jgi:hypothetical protein